MAQRKAVLAVSLLILALSIEASHARDRRWILGELQITEYTDDIVPYDCGPVPAGRECLSIGGFVRAKSRLLTVYAGSSPRRSVDAWIPMDAQPLTTVLYVVAYVQSDGDLKVLDWNQSVEGFCLPSSETKDYGIRLAAERLRRTRPCIKENARYDLH